MKNGNLRVQSLDDIIHQKILRWLIIFKISLIMLNTIAKDSCFHFGYMNKADGEEKP